MEWIQTQCATLEGIWSITYAHVPKEARSKLDDKAVKTIFIGYKHGEYKLYNPMTKKVIVSRDVTFAEDDEWQWNATVEMDSKKRYIYILNDDAEDGVTLEARVVNLDDEVDDNGGLVHFAFLSESEPVRLVDVIKHPKWKRL